MEVVAVLQNLAVTFKLLLQAQGELRRTEQMEWGLAYIFYSTM